MRKRIPHNVWILSITSFLTDVSSEMIFNLLPLFLVNVLGVRTAVVGLIEGLAETTASLIKFGSGALSDYLDNRKTLAVIGYGLSAVAKPLLYFANTWGWVLGVRFTDRVGKGIRSSPRDALLAASTPADRRGLAFGLHRAADTAGAFTGLLIAALVVWVTQAAASTLTRSTFQIVTLISIVPAFLGVLVLAFGAREVISAQSPKTDRQFKFSGLDRRFWAFLGVVVIFTLGNSADAFIILRAQERGLNVLQVLGMLLTFNAVYTLIASPAGALSDRIGRRAVLISGWLVYGLIYLGFAYADTGAQIWLFYGVYGLYYALTEGASRAFVADLVPQEQRGTAYGYFNAGIGLAALPASLIAGILWQGLGSWAGLGPAAPFYFGASLALLSVFLFVIWVK
ncbi:MAG: MFS transporter [Anaerolineales bacterium]|nr:MFS transporter [Anaerolineales bacterium]